MTSTNNLRLLIASGLFGAVALGGLVLATPAHADYGATPVYNDGVCNGRYDPNCLIKETNYYQNSPSYGYNYGSSYNYSSYNQNYYPNYNYYQQYSYIPYVAPYNYNYAPSYSYNSYNNSAYQYSYNYSYQYQNPSYQYSYSYPSYNNNYHYGY